MTSKIEGKKRACVYLAYNVGCIRLVRKRQILGVRFWELHMQESLLEQVIGLLIGD